MPYIKKKEEEKCQVNNPKIVKEMLDKIKER